MCRFVKRTGCELEFAPYRRYVARAMKNEPAATGAPSLHAAERRDGDESIARALALVRFLRQRCPWDAKQDPQSLRPYLLEEAHEVADAIRDGDETALASELGDLLLNVAFQIVLAEERRAFDTEAVIAALETKMEARHPHIYGDAQAPPDWEALKAAEREASADVETGGTDPFRGVAAGLEPLSRAARVQERMAAVGFDWPDLAGPIGKVREEVSELEEAADIGETGIRRVGEADPRVEEEVGDLLFAAVNVSRLAGAHPANALLGAIDKFEDRCRRMVALAEARGIEWRSVGLEALDRLWDEVKSEE